MRTKLRRIIHGLTVTAIVILVAGVSMAMADMERGKRLYKENCAPCHGASGKGDGAGAQGLPVRPADHTDSTQMRGRSDDFLRDVITKGGTAMGLSPFMPAWQGLFKSDEIQDLVGYVRSLAVGTNGTRAKR